MLAEIKCRDFELGCHFSQTPCNIIASCGKLHGIMHQGICAIANPREKKNGANIRTTTNDPAEKKTQADSGTQDRGYSFSQ